MYCKCVRGRESTIRHERSKRFVYRSHIGRKTKIEENTEIETITKKRLKSLLWKYKNVFRRQPGLLTSYEHELKIKEGKPFVGRSYPVPSFVDDTLITQETHAQYLGHLEELLRKLENSNLTLNLTKSRFFKQETKFLGFILTTDGIKPDPEKDEQIKNPPPPHTHQTAKRLSRIGQFLLKIQ